MQYIKKSEYNSFEFELRNCDGSMVDLSNATVKFIVKNKRTDGDDNPILLSQIVNSPTSNVMFEFNSPQTKDLIEGNCVMALKIYRDGGKDEEVWSDDAKIVKGVFSG